MASFARPIVQRAIPNLRQSSFTFAGSFPLLMARARLAASFSIASLSSLEEHTFFLSCLTASLGTPSCSRISIPTSVTILLTHPFHKPQSREHLRYFLLRTEF